MSVSNTSPKAEINPPQPTGNKSALLREIIANRSIYLFISPFYILFLIFGIFPIFFSFYLAFQKWDGIGEMEYVGLAQFRYLISDAGFWQAILNTLEIWLYSTIPMLFFALVIAFLLHSGFVRFKTFYRIAYFLPNVTSIVAVAIIFATLFGNKYGLINFFITSLGFEAVEFLNSSFGIKIAIAAMVVWRWTGYNAIIFLAGLQAIPNSLYEAARIDGASTVQAFFKITIPLLRPVILFTVIMSTIGGMQVFTEPQVLVGNTGGPGSAGMTIVLYLYYQAFIQNQFGYGSAVAWGMFVIIMLFSLINWKIVQRGGAR